MNELQEISMERLYGTINYDELYSTRDVKTGFFWKTGFRLLKTGFKPVFGFTNLHKNIYYYIRQIILILCITHCIVSTRKTVSTLICSFSRFRTNKSE